MNARVIGLYQPYPHTFGGVQAMVLKMARALPGHGYQPLVISPQAGCFTEKLQKESVPFLVSDPGSAWHVYGRGGAGLSYLCSARRAVALLRYWRRLAHELRAHHVALLHCNDYRGVMLAAPAARWARIPVLWHMHGFIPSSAANFIAARLVQWTVPVSRGMLDYLRLPRRWFGRCQVIHNGVEDLSSPAAPVGSSALVLAVGTLHPRKGFETLIDAFARVGRQWPGAECWIVGPGFGDGSYKRKLEQQIQEANLSAQVKLCGARADVAALMAQCRVLCVPSRVEPFGLVAVEAMQAGKPVVATRTGGLPEIVQDGATGYLVAPGDVEATAEALLTLLRHPGLAEQFGRAGRARAQLEFSLVRMMQSFASFYDRLLGPTLGKVPDSSDACTVGQAGSPSRAST